MYVRVLGGRNGPTYRRTGESRHKKLQRWAPPGGGGAIEIWQIKAKGFLPHVLLSLCAQSASQSLESSSPKSLPRCQARADDILRKEENELLLKTNDAERRWGDVLWKDIIRPLAHHRAGAGLLKSTVHDANPHTVSRSHEQLSLSQIITLQCLFYLSLATFLEVSVGKYRCQRTHSSSANP